MYIYLEMGPEVYSGCADRLLLSVNKRAVKKIFVDETLLQIDGQTYWLWVAYEPNLSTYLLNDASIEGKDDFCLLPVLQAVKG
jgi:hypothetical protein